jgi:hypothetical protein
LGFKKVQTDNTLSQRLLVPAQARNAQGLRRGPENSAQHLKNATALCGINPEEGSREIGIFIE